MAGAEPRSGLSFGRRLGSIMVQVAFMFGAGMVQVGFMSGAGMVQACVSGPGLV